MAGGGGLVAIVIAVIVALMSGGRRRRGRRLRPRRHPRPARRPDRRGRGRPQHRDRHGRRGRRRHRGLHAGRDEQPPGRLLAHPGRRGVAAHQPHPVHPGRRHRVRPGHLGRRALLLPRRRGRLHRPRVLPGARIAVRCAGPVRPGLRDRPRGRPPRAEHPGPLRAGPPGAAVPAAGRRRAVGAPRAPGRLLRRPVGQLGVRPRQRRRDHPGRRRATPSTAAEAIGDDRLQEQAGVDVNPETWSHGSSEQRQEWFNRGFEGGQLSLCDTFNTEL